MHRTMQRSMKFSMQYALCARNWHIAQRNTIWPRQCTKLCTYLYGQDIPPVTIGTTLHTSAVQQVGKTKNTKKKIIKKVKFAKKSIKSDWEVIGIRHNMTVEEIAQAMGKDTDQVFEALFYIPKTDKYDQPHKVIKDLNITKQILDKCGFRWKMDEKKKEIIKESKDAFKRPPPDPSSLVKRPPVVTIMGHVDHGKTTLLDALRKSNVVAKEFGGITQHIGAFSVTLPSGDAITFLDTPGHAAFSAMRARGVHVTDIIVLVVAAEDGVMKQTLESIKHAQNAKVPVIVAINKIDKHHAEIEKTKLMLIQSGVFIEEDGGDVPVVPISALKRMNLDQLQETIITVAELLELRADPSGLVEGAVVEAKTDPGRGRVSTVILQRGTLEKGACVVAGTAWGKVRNMFNDRRETLSKVSPGQTAEISGWKELPAAGDTMLQVESEARAKEVVAWRLNEEKALTTLQDLEVIQQKHEVHQREYVALREERLERGRRRGAIFRRLRTKEAIETNEGPELSIVIKADVDGSVEAILNILGSYDSQKCRLVILQHGVGVISEHDIEMAATFGGIIYAFNVTTPPKIAAMAQSQGVEIHDHNVIYKLVDDLKTVLNDRLPLGDEKQIFGEADVVQNFEISVGRKKVPIAGCRCATGELQKSKNFKLVRNGETLFEGSVSSLRHFKDEVSVIKENQDCGVLFSDPSISPQPGDHIICYDVVKVKQQIDWELDF